MTGWSSGHSSVSRVRHVLAGARCLAPARGSSPRTCGDVGALPATSNLERGGLAFEEWLAGQPRRPGPAERER